MDTSIWMKGSDMSKQEETKQPVCNDNKKEGQDKQLSVEDLEKVAGGAIASVEGAWNVKG